MATKKLSMILVIGLSLLLGACATCEPEVREVKVPVFKPVTPPAELRKAVNTKPLPVFVLPENPAATSALTAEGERRLKYLLNNLLTRTQAWTRWGMELSRNVRGKNYD